ncbi:MAG: DNA polymerase III subunit chi [Alphaproteobacteria bacterium]|jgi:DNA polymerase III subunit chi|nr:DNA polymerase III subunit chi [Alphaproteobacteria bacterium]
MTLQVSFYQLMLTPLEKVVPRIVDKIYASNLRALIWVENDEQLTLLNTSLWTYSTLAFVPHGCRLDSEETKDQQPIWLSTTLENPNRSTVCVAANGQIVKNPESFGFDRIADIFDATITETRDGAASFAERLNFYNSKNATITQWQQTKEGWQRLA